MDDDDFLVVDESRPRRATSPHPPPAFIAAPAEAITNIVYRVAFASAVDLSEFARTRRNCVLTTPGAWRCTYYADAFTANMFSSGKWMLFTKDPDPARVRRAIVDAVGRAPVELDVINITMKFYIPCAVDLDAAFDVLAGEGEGFCFMDRQRFPALIVKPFPGREVALEIYARGPVNATGMRNDADIAGVRAFILTRVLPAVASHVAAVSRRRG